MGSVVGAIPPVMGWAAASGGSVASADPFMLASILFLWQVNFNSDLSQLNPILSQLNPVLLQFNPNLSQLNPDLSQLNPDLSQLNPNLSQLNPKTHAGVRFSSYDSSHTSSPYLGCTERTMPGEDFKWLLSMTKMERAVLILSQSILFI